jgi:hypothetical protein
MSRTAAFRRITRFKDYTLPEVFRESVSLLPNNGTLKSAFHRLEATIEEYIDRMPPLPKSPSPRRPVARMHEENTILEMSHPLEGKLGGRRRTYRKRKQSRRRR